MQDPQPTPLGAPIAETDGPPAEDTDHDRTVTVSDLPSRYSDTPSLSNDHDVVYWRLLIEQRATILICVVLTAVSAGVLTLLQSPSYTSTVDIVVGKGQSFFAPAEAGAVQ